MNRSPPPGVTRLGDLPGVPKNLVGVLIIDPLPETERDFRPGDFLGVLLGVFLWSSLGLLLAPVCVRETLPKRDPDEFNFNDEFARPEISSSEFSIFPKICSRN